MTDHDVLRRDGGNERIVKTDDAAAYPHAPCCAGCRRMRICHGCGFPIGGFVGNVCTTGACPRCCAALHKHPRTLDAVP